MTAKELTAARERLGLSPEALAKVLGFSTKEVVRMEEGREPIGRAIDDAIKILLHEL